MLLLRLFKLTKGSRIFLFIKVFLGIMITGTYVAQAFTVAKGFNYAFSGTPWKEYIPIILGIFILITFRAVFMWLYEYYGKLAAASLKERLRIHLFEHFFTIGPGGLQEERTGKIQSVFTDGVEALEVFLVNYIPQILITLLGLIPILIYLLNLDIAIGILVFTAIVICLVSPILWEKLMNKVGKGHWQSYAVLNSQFIDAMQGMYTLKAFNFSKKKGEELEQDSKNLLKNTLERLKVSLTSTAVVDLATAAGTALSIGIGAYGVSNGRIQLGSLFVILFLTAECFRPISDLNMYWHQSFLGISAAEKMFSLLDATPSVEDKLDVQELVLKKHQPPSIEFENLSFAYNQGNREALKSISFKIDSAETVALVGKSGSGKSTVVSLLLRFFEAQQGKIKINDKEIENYSSSDLRKNIAVVLQETYLFHGTVAENILVAKPGAPLKEVENCAKLANAHEFIMKLPQKYNTIVGERGIRLSGGERQRIAIARALLKDAPILILDEATSNVDAANEKIIQNGLDKLMLNRTTLVIAHRLSTIKNADKILVLDSGKLVEQGDSKELIGKKGFYTRLVNAQQAGERREIV